MAKGRIILVLGPTGSGKGTLIRHAREVFPDLKHTISCTTRAPRPGETNGVEYHFLSREEFMKRVDAGEFVEWAQYGENLYGTLQSELQAHLEKGETLCLEIEVQGVRQVKRIFPHNSYTVFIDAGDWEQLEARIHARAPIGATELKKRKDRYDDEISFREEADYCIQNKDGELKSAQEVFVATIREIKESTIG